MTENRMTSNSHQTVFQCLNIRKQYRLFEDIKPILMSIAVFRNEMNETKEEKAITDLIVYRTGYCRIQNISLD